MTCSAMCERDQDTVAALARLAAEWRRLEAEGADLRAEADAWRQRLLADADRLGLGKAIRRRSREE